jgi:hypothetical protein
MASAQLGMLQTVVAGIRRLGYERALLQEGYRFRDWFSPGFEEREAAAVAFGQTPVSMDSACIGVVCANGVGGVALVNRFRALGAPIILEINGDAVTEWAISRKDNGHAKIATYLSGDVARLFVTRADDWKPTKLLRDKNIAHFHWQPQLGLFAGLLPELEEHIQTKLDPLLRETLWLTKAAYQSVAHQPPSATQLFKLVFWLLTAKVFHDRGVGKFPKLSADADHLLEAVGEQYKADVPRLLNRQAREAAAKSIWTSLDFRNLSVEVLAQIWSRTLVDDETRQTLGIHRTPRTIVHYILDKIPFEHSGDDGRTIFEPCSGSGVFLIGAMNKLRSSLFGMAPAERHRYFVNRLVGMENDLFGIEISKLALTLADFPYPGDWNIRHADVFAEDAMQTELARAGVVLCNPPFGDFDSEERELYGVASPKKPAELLRRVLAGLHPMGVLGFVLPRAILDGQGYSGIRKALAERFGSLELTLLPDRFFAADSEIGLLIATNPVDHDVCRVVNARVDDNAEAAEQFKLTHRVSSEHSAVLSIAEAEGSLAVPDLPEVWDYLLSNPVLGEFAEIHRGIEWDIPLAENRDRLVSAAPKGGYMEGVPPQAVFRVFEIPRLAFLNMVNHRRGSAYSRNWGAAKVIMNKSAKSRGRWRIAAFPDMQGLVCYQTFHGVWPASHDYDEVILAAVLNSPVANAYVSTREGKTDITIDTLKRIPMPVFTDIQKERIRSLVALYRAALRDFMSPDNQESEKLIKEIDATVLDGYRMPPALERQLLDWFNGHDRPVAHSFSNYFPDDFDAYFSLSDYLSPGFGKNTAANILSEWAR